MHTAQRIAYAYGFLGKQAQLRKLAANKAVLAIEAEANLPLYVGVFGLAGAVDAANRLAEPLAAEMMAAIASVEPLKLAGRGSDIDLWFSRLLKTQQRLRLVELIGKWECDDIRLLGEGNKLSAEVKQHVRREQARCGIDRETEAKAYAPQRKQPKPTDQELRARFAKRVAAGDAGSFSFRIGVA